MDKIAERGLRGQTADAAKGAAGLLQLVTSFPHLNCNTSRVVQIYHAPSPDCCCSCLHTRLLGLGTPCCPGTPASQHTESGVTGQAVQTAQTGPRGALG